MMDLPWLYGKVYRNRSRRSHRVEKNGQVEGLCSFGAYRRIQTKSSACLRLLEKNLMIFSNRSKQAKAKAKEKTDKKEGKGQSVRWKAWWRQSNIKCTMSEEYASCWTGCTKIATWQTRKK